MIADEFTRTHDEVLGRTDQAQAFHWDCFDRVLGSSRLRDYLKRLHDFDDVEAKERALSRRASSGCIPTGAG